MTKLARLIAELCPNGVEYKTLGDVCSLITKGTTPSAFEKKGVSFIKTEAIDGLKIDKRKLSFINQSIHEEDLKRSILQENDILFAIAGSIGKCAVITKDLLPANTNQALAIIRLIESVNRNYILHMLQSQYMKEYIFRSVKGSAQPNLNLQQMNNFPIPIPPIPIQQEIVRILDKFTQLETEIEVQLTAELEARKKQYEYYRNTLLTFDEESTILKTSRPADQQTSRPADQQTSRRIVHWMTLGEVGRISMCKRIFKEQTNSTGDIPFYKIGTFGKKPDAYISQEVFDKYKSKYSFPKKGDVLISAAGTIGRTVIYDGEPAYYQDSNIVWIDNDESQVLNKYLFYYYSLQPWQTSSGGTIARLYNDNICKTSIPVPPLAEQERIVSILDRFDALTNDITTGLPAEIAARRKQYEYYRDKLLTFKEVA